MDKQQWKQITQIVDTALELADSKRRAFIEEQCEHNPALKSEVITLLESIEKSGKDEYLERQGAFPTHLAADLSRKSTKGNSSLIGKRIGKYKINKLIGHGGMGSVFRAERADDAYEGTVALKVMRRGMDTPSNIARFKRERNILARLDHPNIARILDGGITSGLPYLVMEYIDGIPLYEYCDQHQLSVKKRLNLYNSICKAVQHAHKNAIIHRDLKPSNILVTENGNIKILDFGIAKLMEPTDAEPLLKTRTDARMLTLGYAAPEQVESEPATTATDTYALGTLLYELLAGIHPFDLQEKNLTEVEEVIRSKTPPKPSQKFQTLTNRNQIELAEQRNTEPSSLVDIIQGDLDAIVMMALRKEPNERYNSVDQLLDELQKYHHNKPVSARQNSYQYKAKKFIKRNKKRILGAASVLLLIGVTIGYYTYQLSQQQKIAQREAKKAQQAVTFLTNLIKANYPANAQGDTVTVREFLNRGFEEVRQLNRSPAIKANVMQIMAHTYQSLGEFDKADSLISQVVAMQDTVDISTSEKAKSYNLYGLILRDRGHISEAEQAMEQSAELYKQTGNTQTAELAKLLRDLAYVKRMLGDYKQALLLVRQALDIERQIYGKRSIQSAETYYILASILQHQNKYNQAKKNQLTSLKIINANIEGPHPGKSSNYNNLANIYERQDSLQKAKEYYQKTLRMDKQIYSNPHPSIATTYSNLADVLKHQGKLDSAKILQKRAINIRKQTSGKEHPYLATDLSDFANIYRQQKKYKKADSLYARAVDIFKLNYESDHPKIVSAKFNRAVNAHLEGNHAYAEQLIKTVLAIRKERYEASNDAIQIPLNRLLSILKQNNRTAEADSLQQAYLE